MNKTMYVKNEPEAVRTGGRHRVEAFARRLEEASRAHPRCPTDAHRGKQKWLREELMSRFGIQVSAESVSKWFGAKVMPRPSLIGPIAGVLNVNEVWLVSGVPPMKGKVDYEAMASSAPVPASTSAPAISKKAVRAPARASHPIPDPAPAPEEFKPPQVFIGAVDLVAGMVQMVGGTVAFPGPREDGIMFVLLNGKSHVVQVLLANEVGKARYSIKLPDKSNATAIVAVVPGDHPFDARFIVIGDEMRQDMAGGELLVEKTFRGFTCVAGEVREIASLVEL